MPILDAFGDELKSSPDSCPNCHTPEKKFISHKTFGGYWKTVCPQCGTVIASGQGNAPEGVT